MHWRRLHRSDGCRRGRDDYVPGIFAIHPVCGGILGGCAHRLDGAGLRTISRRRFLTGFPPALSAPGLEQPYPPYTPVPEDNPMALSEEAWRMNIIGIVALHWYMLKNQGMEIRRLKWLMPGPELYTNKEGDT
jgi:hypothetical protein